MANTASYGSAYDALVATLNEWGLGSLASSVLTFLQDGYTQDQVSVMMQSTPAYKQRFAGNEKRKAAGIPVLAPRDYLSVESAYRQILSTSGMPVGFYDHPNDFADWIGNDVAPQEISTRVGLAVDAADRMDAATKQTFQSWYGVGPGDLAAFFLDQSRAEPLIKNIAKGTQLGADYTRNGLTLDKARAEQLGGLAGDRNVDQLAAQVSEATQGGERLSNIYGGPDYRQADAEAEVFQTDEAARQKRLGLSAMETAAFSGRSGVGQNTLSKAKSY